MDDLWSQFAADAQSSYGFYGKDVNWEEINKLRCGGVFPAIKQFFGADEQTHPSPPRSTLVAIALLLISGPKIHYRDQFSFDFNSETFAALLFLLLLSLELADKVIMSATESLAKSNRGWCLPIRPQSREPTWLFPPGRRIPSRAIITTLLSRSQCCFGRKTHVGYG